MSSLEERIAKLERLVEAQQAIIEAKDAEIARLQARLEVLERRLSENSSNSNKPPSSDGPEARGKRPSTPSGRPRGGQKGHKGHRRVLLPPERVQSTTHCYPPSCRRCNARLPRRPDKNPLRHQVIDTPPTAASADEYLQHRVVCACGETTCGELPAGVPSHMFGPNLLALVAVLVGDCHVSRRKVQALLRDVHGVDVSLGALSEAEEVISEAVAPAVDEATAHALAARVKHADGTTWYQAGEYRALWTLATTAVTVFVIAGDATRATLRTWLDRVRGVLVSDRGKQFDFWTADRRQLCWAHLIRKFASFAERRGETGVIGRDLLFWSRVLLRAWHRARDGTLSRSEFRATAASLRVLIEHLLEHGSASTAPGVGGACRDILSYRAALWFFVEHPAVEPTNNHAERELRGFVLWRRSSYGSQSDRGARYAARIKSVIHTCRKQQRPVLAYLAQACTAALRGRQAPSLLPAR